MLTDEHIDKIIKDLDVITPDVVRSWHYGNNDRLQLLAVSMVMGYVDFYHAPGLGLIPEQKNTLLVRNQDPEGSPDFIPADGDGAYRLVTIQIGLNQNEFTIDGDSFRAWLKRYRRDSYYKPDKSHHLTEYDVIQECSDALYPNGRDVAGFDYKKEKQRIIDWLDDKFTLTGKGKKVLKDRLVFSIIPAKNPKPQSSIKRKK